MNNCYFCHRPVSGELGRLGSVEIRSIDRDIKGQQPATVIEHAHKECLESAVRCFEPPAHIRPYRAIVTGGVS